MSGLQLFSVFSVPRWLLIGEWNRIEHPVGRFGRVRNTELIGWDDLRLRVVSLSRSLGVEHPFVQGATRIIFSVEKEFARTVFFRDDANGAAVDGKHADGIPVNEEQCFARELGHGW